MFDWNYNQKAYEEKQFEIIPVGDHRVRIDEIKERESRSTGYPMLEITLAVSGFSSRLWFYLVFNRAEPDKTNRALGSIFDSFGIQPGNLNIRDWVNKVGGARVKHELFDGQNRPKLAYFLTSEKVRLLPPWQGSEPAVSFNVDLPFDL